MQFLPVNYDEMQKRGWNSVDFVLVTGDAYVDDPSFGPAIIGRVLERYGYRVAVLAQPDWHSTEAFTQFGKPELGFLVTAGNLDSMVSHYTVNKRRRHKDVYTPGGVPFKRPDRATIVYCGRIREAYKSVPIIIGGIEASLRRFAHYDYWQDKVRRSILFDSRADLLVYGMGEKAIVEIAEALKAGIPIQELTYIKGTACIVKEKSDNTIELPSYEAVVKDKRDYARAAKQIQNSNDPFEKRSFIQACNGRYLLQNPPQMPLTETEMDDVYDLPYTYQQHLSTLEQGPVPGIEEIKFSITANRGCFGNCHFCALAIHQGRYVQKRSKASIVREAQRMIRMPDFKGYIHDVGGPTANFRNPACKKQMTKGVCQNRQCLYPSPCKNLNADESDYLDILRTLRKLPGVKKVFVRSGIRYDYMLEDSSQAFFKELVRYHVSGQLRVAPEHCVDRVLDKMGKPAFGSYIRFLKKFQQYSKQAHKDQYVVPYFISGHPGCTLEDAICLSEYIRDHGAVPDQVQDFYPTPGSLATAMYYTEIDPRTMQPIYVPKEHEKHLQRALIQYNRPENHALVYEALIKAGRQDLIGNHKKALIRAKNSDYKREKHIKNRNAADRPSHNKKQGNGRKNGQRIKRKKTNRVN